MENYSDAGKKIHRIGNLQLFEMFAEEISTKPYDKLTSEDMSFMMLRQISAQLHRQTKLLEMLAAEILKPN